MRIVTSLIVSLFALPLVLVACDSHDDGDAEPFDTLQACYDDHHGDEGLSVTEAIVVCCIDHPIAGVHPSCGAAKADCITNVRAKLDSSVLASDIETACADYETRK